MAEDKLTDDDIRAVFEHLQNEIEFMASALGQTLGAAVFFNPSAREHLELCLSNLDGIAMARGQSQQSIMERIRRNADESLAASRRLYPPKSVPDPR